ncbi:GNAT family N-acetyltransferase [Blastococcus saxobsidens]|uniref:Ribosomal protein S18 acetylase RimI-like enzyme n=1 Tax=Blastococcus saxobsidens TaxID=138336 RepID=A0A4Q7Y883_9ACTN|nr:GNAT family N-acetyltransferase [Blastococcus saxobsidens]RZU32928.1 ribosomal protein S18 acetylase RimI-like enzyme [Blastococcus saxobsidens]
MEHTVRPVRAHEWQQIRTLRLEALSDEAAPQAFLETYAQAAGRLDEFWQERARGSSVDAGPDADARQFVAITGDGTWVGTAVGLVEKAGAVDFQGSVVEEPGGHVAGVYLHPDHRGRGVMDLLFEAVTDWLRGLGLPRVRLYVHADNTCAQRFYEKAGFRDTGDRFTGSIGPEIEMARPL